VISGETVNDLYILWRTADSNVFALVIGTGKIRCCCNVAGSTVIKVHICRQTAGKGNRAPCKCRIPGAHTKEEVFSRSVHFRNDGSLLNEPSHILWRFLFLLDSHHLAVIVANEQLHSRGQGGTTKL